MAGEDPIDRVVEHCTTVMIAALVRHGDLASGHTAELLRIVVEPCATGTQVSLTWRDFRPDGTSGTRETTWTLGRSLAEPRSSA